MQYNKSHSKHVLGYSGPLKQVWVVSLIKVFTPTPLISCSPEHANIRKMKCLQIVATDKNQFNNNTFLQIQNIFLCFTHFSYKISRYYLATTNCIADLYQTLVSMLHASLIFKEGNRNKYSSCSYSWKCLYANIMIDLDHVLKVYMKKAYLKNESDTSKECIFKRYCREKGKWK